MGKFNFEQSDPDRFQQLCQSLIVAEFPHVHCYPVGQADGGRDAMQWIKRGDVGSKATRLFQVKFVREPAKIRDVHKWLEHTIAEEAPKVETIASRGVDIEKYILITNVPGTAYLESGTMDQANQLLQTALPVNASMWWRDDIDRRCEARPHIAWAYPEILRAVDILAALSEFFPDAYNDSRQAAIRKFLIEQQEEDSEIRFQQVELTNDLLSLFVDVPAEMVMSQEPKHPAYRLTQAVNSVATQVEAELASEHKKGRQAGERGTGAAALILNSEVASIAPHIVLEGGPGQGKSTLGQFVCQVHRMNVLGGLNDNLVASYYRPTSARLPIKIDLREYATWLAGKNPFEKDIAVERPTGTNKSLESFIAALVSDRSGGMEFTVNDLNALAAKSAFLVVLDGLDEVADVALRNQVVREISAAVRRLKDNAASLQVVVTTRPSALAEVAGFPSKLFTSWTLSSLTVPLIAQYAEKWSVSERLNSRERGELRKILSEKLHQAHMRELARNPMQLTILLSLIRTRGASLPDKRTTLYERYVDLFFAREAGKNDVVRTFRDELIDIHCYLAWVLHAEAEKGRALGKIETSRLRQVLRDYLTREERDPELVDKLFLGVTQRVVFLVGAIEGQYQFEVQPLREYFAARFLYENAPHSSMGNPKAG
ncbi:NACHT domain-containing protein, partial [Actinomadura adrarensis]